MVRHDSDSGSSLVTNLHYFTPLQMLGTIGGGVLAGGLLRMPLNAFLHDKAPFATFVPSVILATWAGGFWGGTLGTFVSVIVYYAALCPLLHMHAVEWPFSLPFAAVGLMISGVGQVQINAKRKLVEIASEARRAADILRESEARKSTILKVAPDSIITMDTNGLIIEFNPAAEAMFGYARDEVVGKPLVEQIIPPSLRKDHNLGLASYLATGEGPILNKRIEVNAMRKDGREFPAELAVIANDQQEGVEFTAYLRDISDRKTFEQELLKSEERLRLAMEGAKVGAWHWDIASDELVWSETMYELSGRRHEHHSGLESFMENVHPDDVSRVRASMAEAIENRREFDAQMRFIWPDGSIRWLVARGRAYYSASGEPLRMEGIAIDITAMKEAEALANARAEREALINALEEAWRSTLDSDRIQQYAAEALGNALRADRCFYMVVSAADRSVTVGEDFRAGNLPSVAGHYRTAEEFAGELTGLYGGETFVVDDAWEGGPAALAARLGPLRIRSLVSVPLALQGRLAASLTVAMVEAPRSWTSDDVALVEAVAAHTRLAIESARAQEREHRIAAELQSALIPELPASIAGLALSSFMAPALDEASVGGDFWDLFALGPDRYGIVIGDVSGKGLAAAAQLSVVRNMLRCLFYDHRGLVQAVTRLNAITVENDLLAGFVTIFVGVYNAVTGVVAYVSCGHEPPMVLRSQTHRIDTLAQGGLPLGVSGASQYEEHRVKLGSGDTLLLYTDGIVEAGPDRVELLGRGGLARLFEDLDLDTDFEGASEALVGRAADFGRGGFRDDVCAILARRR